MGICVNRGMANTTSEKGLAKGKRRCDGNSLRLAWYLYGAVGIRGSKGFARMAADLVLGGLPRGARRSFLASGLSADDAILGLAVFEVAVDSAVTLDQLFADSANLFHDFVAHVLLLI
jgi:hypothetical protein